MSGIVVGDKFKANPTTRNTLNGVDPSDDIRIGLIEPDFISIHVIKRSGATQQLAVPRGAFGGNFENDRFHLAPPNRGYAMLKRPMTIYK